MPFSSSTSAEERSAEESLVASADDSCVEGEGEEEGDEALEHWFRCNGGTLHCNLLLARAWHSRLHWHWHGSADLDPGSVVVTVPHSLALSCLNALVDDAFPVFRLRRDAFTVEAIGFFYLAAQYLSRDRSFWTAYLDALPAPNEDFSQPLWFEEAEDVAWLAGTDVWHTSCSRKKVYENYFSAGIAALADCRVPTEPYSWRLFKWAITIFSSRSFTSHALRPHQSSHWTTYKTDPDNGQRQPVLLDMSAAPAEDLDFPVLFPVMDASNHSHDAKVNWFFAPDRFTLSVAERIPPGREILNNYGPKANDELLLGYGFCIPDNPHDNVVLALKAPPPALRDALRRSDPRFFTAAGVWDAEKSTFRLRRPPADSAAPESIFHSLPGPLLELLVYILRFERGLEFTSQPNPTSYLLSEPDSGAGQGGGGSRYLFLIARLLTAALAPKLTALRATQLPNNGVPTNHKQTQASIYRAAQVDILQALLHRLRAYTRSLLSLSPHQTHPGPKLVTLEGLHALLFPASNSSSAAAPAAASHIPAPPPPLCSDFLAGLAPSTGGATDLTHLRLAGWEEDLFVLLLCWLALTSSSQSSQSWPEYIDPSLFAAQTDAYYYPAAPDDGGGGEDNDLILLVRAAAAVRPRSLWADERWSARFIASVGGAMVRHESALVMSPALPEGSGEEEEARLCVYLHG